MTQSRKTLVQDLDSASNYAANAATHCLQAKNQLQQKDRDEVWKLSLELTRISAALARISMLQ